MSPGRAFQEPGLRPPLHSQRLGITLKNLLCFRKRKQTGCIPTRNCAAPLFRGALHFVEAQCIVCEPCEKACSGARQPDGEDDRDLLPHRGEQEAGA